MGNQKKNSTKEQNTKVKDSEMFQNSAENSNMSEEIPVAPKPKKIPKLNDTVTVNVQSNVFGELIYVDDRSGANVKWHEFGDVQPMSLGDLRVMRNTQRAFFSNNWIFVKEILDDGYEELTAEDVYKNLMVAQYYKDVLNPDNFNSIFRMDEDEMRVAVGRMSNGARMNLVVACNDAIRRGKLDSLRKIRVLEEILGCELMEL